MIAKFKVGDLIVTTYDNKIGIVLKEGTPPSSVVAVYLYGDGRTWYFNSKYLKHCVL